MKRQITGPFQRKMAIGPPANLQALSVQCMCDVYTWTCYVYLHMFLVCVVRVCACYGIHCCRTFTCIPNIISLVCVSDLPTHYVYVMASCGIVRLLCSSVGFLGTSLWVCILQRSGEKGECVYTCVCGVGYVCV